MGVTHVAIEPFHSPPHFGGDLLISHGFQSRLEVWSIVFNAEHRLTSSQLNGHIVDNHFTVILAARADLVFYLGVVQEHVAAAAGSDLNFGKGFLDLAGFKGDAHE